MFNLIPDSLKEKVISEYKLRRLTLVIIFLMFIQISFIILIFPSWVASYYKEQEIMSQVNELNQLQSSKDSNSLVSIIRSTNAKLNILNTVLAYPAVLPLLNTVLDSKPSTVYINKFSYTSNSLFATINVGGISATREGLVAFVKNLQKTNMFKTVNLPVSNLAKDKNIDFSLDLVSATSTKP